MSLCALFSHIVSVGMIIVIIIEKSKSHRKNMVDQTLCFPSSYILRWLTMWILFLFWWLNFYLEWFLLFVAKLKVYYFKFTEEEQDWNQENQSEKNKENRWLI
jgi:hypothetical protein